MNIKKSLNNFCNKLPPILKVSVNFNILWRELLKRNYHLKY